ncbi:MAG: MATE family efflux transporter [Oscillospiraceae bacterium]|nr:MATE family efflux transporter [Oscillospiraceae bacterium]
MSKQHTNDLGRDPIGSLLARLAGPAILAQLINALYNLVDRVYIGQGVGDLALTALGVTFPILMIISAFSAFVGMGGAPRVAIKMGEGKRDEAEQILSNCFVVLISLSVALTAVFLIFGRPLLMLFGASGNTVEDALSYLNIYVSGTIFVQISLGLNAFISTQGFARTSMMTVLIGAIANILLDPLFIFVFHMGVQGAALATILSQALSAGWVLRFLFSKKSQIKIRPKYFRVRREIILPVMALGISPFIMQSTESLVNICLNSSLQRYGGDLAVGAMTILTSVMQLFMLPIQGLSQSAQPIMGFNFGAKQMDRVRLAFRYMLICSLSYSTLIFLLAQIAPQVFVGMFSSSPELFDKGVWALRIYMGGTFLMGAQLACQQTFVALGQAKTSLCLALLRKIILLIPLIYILPFFFADKVFAVFLAEPIADITAALSTSTVFLLRFGKILKRKLEEGEGPVLS